MPRKKFINIKKINSLIFSCEDYPCDELSPVYYNYCYIKDWNELLRLKTKGKGDCMLYGMFKGQYGTCPSLQELQNIRTKLFNFFNPRWDLPYKMSKKEINEFKLSFKKSRSGFLINHIYLLCRFFRIGIIMLTEENQQLFILKHYIPTYSKDVILIYYIPQTDIIKGESWGHFEIMGKYLGKIKNKKLNRCKIQVRFKKNDNFIDSILNLPKF